MTNLAVKKVNQIIHNADFVRILSICDDKTLIEMRDSVATVTHMARVSYESKEG